MIKSIIIKLVMAQRGDDILTSENKWKISARAQAFLWFMLRSNGLSDSLKQSVMFRPTLWSSAHNNNLIY